MTSTDSEVRDVGIVGGGPAGLSAAVYTANAGLDTLIIENDSSILKRNAHLENYLGFPAGINPRLFLRMARDQVERAGGDFEHGTVERISRAEDEDTTKFEIETKESSYEVRNVIAASWSDPSYLEPLGVEIFQEGSKQFISIDGSGSGNRSKSGTEKHTGRTNVDGVYAAGRLAHQYHQTIVSAGHGAQVALTLIDDVDPEYYHDWTVPEGYFTNRGREVPKGCEEIPREERFRREEESVEVMKEYFEEPLRDEPVPHPSLE